MIRAVLFDLDGTLLPMDQDDFVKDYFGRLARYLAPHGFEPNSLINAIWQGTGAMLKNDGSATNEERFWCVMQSLLGADVRSKEHLFESFYAEEFDNVRHSCGFDEAAAATVCALKERGYRMILATSPIFPAIATRKRLAWAGLSPDDFELVTSYENSRHSKPSLEYYKDVIESRGLSAEECIMVGNDVGEDMVAEALGMKVYLVPRDLINRVGKDITVYPQGSLSELPAYLDGLG